MSSSDSDSDMCDLFSNFSKKAAKTDDTFWSTYTLKNDDVGPITESKYIESNEKVTQSQSSSSNQSVNVVAVSDIDSEEISNIDTMVLSEESQNDNTVIPSESKVEVSPTDIVNTIKNRIEDISQMVKEILDQPRGGRRGRKGRGRGNTRGGRGGRGRRRNRQLTLDFRNISVIGSIPQSTLVIKDEDMEDVKIVPPEISPVVSINVLWKSVDTHVFKVRKFDKLKAIKEFYITNKQANPQLLFFTLDNKEIDLENNSYVSLRLTDDHVIEGSVLPETYLNKPRHCCSETKHDYSFTVQNSARRSKPLIVQCQNSDKMDVIFWQVSLELGVSIENIKLYFDGKVLNPNDQIAYLDLEDGDCFDLNVLS